MSKINQEEYEVLKELDDKWRWIARDENKALWVFAEKPVRTGESNIPSWWYTKAGRPCSVLELIDEIHLFQFIQWEDEEPHNIAELIEEYESKEREVKKDLNWFKEQLDDIEMNTPSLWSHSSIWMLDRVNELLNQLDEPEVLSKEFINEKAVEIYADTADAEVHAVFRMRDLQNLLVPEQELAVVPQEVADWYENHKDNLEKQLQGIAYNLDKHGTMPVLNKVDDWINKTEKPLQTLASLSFGYEVEEEQKYFAKIKGHENIGSDDKYWNYCITDESLDIGDNKVHADVLAEYVLNATKDEWENLGINDDNADFIKVEEMEE